MQLLPIFCIACFGILIPAIIKNNRVPPWLRKHLTTGLQLSISMLTPIAFFYFAIIMLANLLPFDSANNVFVLPPNLTFGKIFFLATTGLLFLSRFGPLIALAHLLFLLINIFLIAESVAITSGFVILMTTLTVIAGFSDYLPWQTKENQRLGQGIRSSYRILLSLVAVCVTIMALRQGHDFSLWLDQHFDTQIPVRISIAFLLVILTFWLGVALGRMPPGYLPIATLPTLFVSAFISTWSSTLFLIPVTLIIALTLVDIDPNPRDRHNDYYRL